MVECMEVLKWEKFLLTHNYVCASITFSEVVGLVKPKNEALVASSNLNCNYDKMIKSRSMLYMGTGTVSVHIPNAFRLQLPEGAAGN